MNVISLKTFAYFKIYRFWITFQDTCDIEYNLFVFAFDNSSKTVLSNMWDFGKLKKENKKDGCVRFHVRQVNGFLRIDFYFETLYFRSSELLKSTLFVFVLTKCNFSKSTDKSEIGWCSVNVHETIRSSSISSSCSSPFVKGSCRVLCLPPEGSSSFFNHIKRFHSIQYISGD